MKATLALLLLVLAAASALPAMAGTPWFPIGPEGGDARAFAQDPSDPGHLYLGSLSGWIYDTHDDGAHWHLLAEIDGRDDLVLDNLLTNPQQPNEVLVGAWVLGSPDGGIYRSTDKGHTWTVLSGMKGQSVRALSRSASNPNLLVAGTLQGVFRSMDNGNTWSRISPPENAEIHEVESIAIDPRDPQIIYAGTWHLPWKTTDGGATWHNVKQGLIDDSDVFSIILDPVVPTTVYLSACSGIYKSTDGAAEFTKVQGIPSTARRTRVLMQDPVDRNVVYAGTTEGLYKTLDGGKVWSRMSAPDLIVNDISIDPRNPAHVLLATDRSGVLLSENAGASFADANRGVLQQQVSALAADPANANLVYAAVLNDKAYGGVFASPDGGNTWSKRSTGLAGRDVYSLAVLPNGDLLAGTNRGLALWTGQGPWQSGGRLVEVVKKSITYSQRNPRTHKLERKTELAEVASPAKDITARVGEVSIVGDLWFAATAEGLLRSFDRGSSWQGGPVLDQTDLHLVSSYGDMVATASLKRVFVSTNDGTSWLPTVLPAELTQVTALQVSPGSQLWVGGPEGVWLSRDLGASFEKCSQLPINQISSIRWDPMLRQVVITSATSGTIFATADGGATWSFADGGWPLRTAMTAAGHFYGATMFHGVVRDELPVQQALRRVKGN